MCCIIHRPKKAKEIPFSTIESIIQINYDGWGISYMKDNQLQVEKSMNMDEALYKIRELEKGDVEFLFHARYATHGAKNLENCHPYKINNGVLFHNGKISVYRRHDRFSDTYYFALKVNRFLRKRKSIDWILEKFKSSLGSSRLAFMNHSGEIKKHGDWFNEDGCYYSKLNWKWRTQKSSAYCNGGADDPWAAWEEYYGQACTPNHKYVDKRKSSASHVPTFQEVLKCCSKGESLYSFIVQDLSTSELVELATKYPGLCAEYLTNRKQYSYDNRKA